MREELVLRVSAKALAPFIVAFALYVHFHGDYSPGGGFQAGVILAAAFVLLTLVYGVEAVQRVLPPRFVQACAALGVLLYAGTGVVTMMLGGAYLGYGVLAHDPEHGQHYGILLVEAGVLVTVFGVMATVFYLFAGRDGAAPGERTAAGMRKPAGERKAADEHRAPGEPGAAGGEEADA